MRILKHIIKTHYFFCVSKLTDTYQKLYRYYYWNLSLHWMLMLYIKASKGSKSNPYESVSLIQVFLIRHDNFLYDEQIYWFLIIYCSWYAQTCMFDAWEMMRLSNCLGLEQRESE